MTAYYRSCLSDFLRATPQSIVGTLDTQYAADGYVTQFVSQVRAWHLLIPMLQEELKLLVQAHAPTADWSILLEYPLYRLRKRLDIVILAGRAVFVVEAKVGETRFLAADGRQVEAYALDLRDFHEESRHLLIVPVLWATAAESTRQELLIPIGRGATPLLHVGERGLTDVLVTGLKGCEAVPSAEAWDNSAYRPVPSIIEAATNIFAGQAIREMTQADASNLQSAANRLIDIIVQARRTGRRAVAFLTGVPGSGKTLAGLRVVHDAVATGAEHRGDIIYLSGNTPLVTVLREALALDEVARQRASSKQPRRERIRREVRTRIQHINEFLKNQLQSSGIIQPHEHVIVFDEAQRAWDAGQGDKKFGRKKSEPELILDIMGSHQDWCVCICLIGSGQEINDGELGIQGWHDALAASDPKERGGWEVYAPGGLFDESRSPSYDLFEGARKCLAVNVEPDLALQVPMRMFRAPEVSKWVGLVLSGDIDGAQAVAGRIGDYKILITRSLQVARQWLRSAARGDRRYGLVASSGARRLRADGLGQILSATDGDSIAH
jgi:hypothetical protein